MRSLTSPRPDSTSGLAHLPPQALQQVAAFFQVLADPTRLQILELLRRGESSAGALAERCGCSAANVSRHLAVLVRQGLVTREKRGTTACLRIADDSVYALCDLVCDSIGRRLQLQARQGAVFSPTSPPTPNQEP